MKENEKIKLQFRTNNQNLKTVKITKTTEQFWSALVFRVKHI